jgi:hypothetical protein
MPWRAKARLVVYLRKLLILKLISIGRGLSCE